MTKKESYGKKLNPSPKLIGSNRCVLSSKLVCSWLDFYQKLYISNYQRLDSVISVNVLRTISYLIELQLKIVFIYFKFFLSVYCSYLKCFFIIFCRTDVACVCTIFPQCLSNTLYLTLPYSVRSRIKLTNWLWCPDQRDAVMEIPFSG